MEEIKGEEINEMLKNMLTLGQYVELLQLMIKECEIFMDNNGGCSSGLAIAVGLMSEREVKMHE